VMEAGRIVDRNDDLAAARQRFERALSGLPAAARRLRAPTAPDVRRSPALEELFARVEAELRGRRAGADRTSG
jgi:nicotinate phosphoribosyltransferase